MQYIQLQGQVAADLDSPINGAFNLFIDTADGTIKAKDSDGNLTSAGGGMVETTYSEISASFVAGTLTAGTYYKITDFKTCYDQPDYDYMGQSIQVGNYKTGSVSPIIVFALDSGSLASDAFQSDYPKDNIKYDITFDRTEVTHNPAFGRITYRKDNQGNTMDYDFREVLFKRYDAYSSDSVYDGEISIEESGSVGFITGSGTSFQNFETGSVIGVLNINGEPIVSYYEIISIEGDNAMIVTGSVYQEVSETRLVNSRRLEAMSWKQNNILSNTASAEYLTFTNIEDCFNNVCTSPYQHQIWEERTFLLPINVFIGGAYEDNSFVTNFRNNTFSDDCDSNVITGNFRGNIIDEDFDNNVIHGDFYDNIIDIDFRNNLIMGGFWLNNLGDDDEEDFENNVIYGDFFNNFYTGVQPMDANTFNNDFYSNIILYGLRENSFYSAYNNIFAEDFNDNKVGDNFHDNTFYSSVYNNTIGAGFYENSIGLDNEESYFEQNHIGYEFKGNQILGDFISNTIGDYFTANQIGYDFEENVIGHSFIVNDIESNFQENTIGNLFESNQIEDNFQNNKIGHNFYNNSIGASFGVYSSDRRGNVIGNDFKDNNILRYFWDNNIGDRFKNNDVGFQFQHNRIETSIIEVDFTQYLGRINTIEVAGGNPVAGSDGIYSGITATSSTTQYGIGAEFTINVVGSLISTVDITNFGKLYEINDTITIDSSSFGGVEDLILTIDTIQSTPMVYEPYNKTIQKRFDETPVLISLTDNNEWYISSNITEPID